MGILALAFSLSCKTIEGRNESEGVALNLALFVYMKMDVSHSLNKILFYNLNCGIFSAN